MSSRDRWAVPTGASREIVAELQASGIRFRIGDHWSTTIDGSVLSSETAGGFVGTVWVRASQGPRVGTLASPRVSYDGLVADTQV